MRYLKIKELDIADGPGCRISIFVAGCRRHCFECFNPETWDFKTGDEYTDQTKDRIIELLGHPYIDGLSILGGEPFEPENQETILDLVQLVSTELPDKSIWAYTGFTIEELVEQPMALDIIEHLDILVDGEFLNDLKDLKLQYCGSKNQRVIDIPKTFTEKKLVVHDNYDFNIIK